MSFRCERFRFLVDAFFSGIRKLTAFKWNAKGVNGGRCRYEALTAFCSKVSGVSGAYAAILEK